jgi:hypothetical protein
MEGVKIQRKNQRQQREEPEYRRSPNAIDIRSGGNRFRMTRLHYL